MTASKTAAARPTLYQLNMTVLSTETKTSKDGKPYRVATVETTLRGKTVQAQAIVGNRAFNSLRNAVRKGAKLTVSGYWSYNKMIVLGRGRGFGKPAAVAA